jgi:hypothetical protein
LFFIIFAWIWGARKLGQLYNQKTQEKEGQAKATVATDPAMAKATTQQ